MTPSGASQSTPLEQTAALLLLVLQKQHPCQKDEDDLEGEDEPLDDETAEYDWLVIETALEVIAALSTALGEQFAELWQIFQQHILKYASSQERFERSSAVGTIADCVEGMGQGVSQYTKRLMAVLLKRLGDEDAEVKSNAAFGTGLLCEKSGDGKEVLSHYPAILGKLEPLLDPSSSSASSGTTAGADDPHARLLDNAAGCLARMIRAHPQNVPLEEVLPRLVGVLPLRQDFCENEPVFEMLVALYQERNGVVQGLTGRLMPVFEAVLQQQGSGGEVEGEGEEMLSAEVRGKVLQLVRFLRSS